MRSENFSDITFSIEGEKVPAHKAILATQCKYFSAMFQSGLMKEDEDASVKLDVPLREFNIILAYIYTGKMKAEDEEEALQVLSLCQEYLLTDLSDKIEEKFRPKITMENVFKILKLSTALGLDSIITMCCEFIAKNLKVVLESERLNELTTKTWEYILKSRIKENYSVSEIELFKYIVKWVELNAHNVEIDEVPKIFENVRLELISLIDLLQIVRKSSIYSADKVLDAIQDKYSKKTQCHYCKF